MSNQAPQSLLNVALSIKNIRQSEVILPIARLQAMVSSLLLGDHTSLKTALISPQLYDREMIKCIHNHTTILGVQEESGKEIKYSYDDLTSKISNIDKVCLIWALFKSTYNTLGKREVQCNKCKSKNEYLITLDELIQEDTFTVWPSELPHFTEYTHTIEVPYDNNYVYIFDTFIPSIQRNNQILGMITIEKLQENLETNSVLSSSEQLGVVVKKLTIKQDDKVLASSSNLIDILAVLDAAIPSEVSEDVQDKYNKEFNKYQPKFYTNLGCSCGNSIKHTIDIESDFFRRALLGRETSR